MCIDDGLCLSVHLIICGLAFTLPNLSALVCTFWLPPYVVTIHHLTAPICAWYFVTCYEGTWKVLLQHFAFSIQILQMFLECLIYFPEGLLWTISVLLYGFETAFEILIFFWGCLRFSPELHSLQKPT